MKLGDARPIGANESKAQGEEKAHVLGLGCLLPKGQVFGCRWVVSIPSGEVSVAPHTCKKIPGPKYPPIPYPPGSTAATPSPSLEESCFSTKLQQCTAGLHHSIAVAHLPGFWSSSLGHIPPSHAPITWAAATAPWSSQGVANLGQWLGNQMHLLRSLSSDSLETMAR